MKSTYDVLCVGGGVIGLMTAYELALRGRTVAVFDKGAIGREASWAGAGIISPASREHVGNDLDRLRAFSYARFGELAEKLLEETGLDIGYRRSGGLELALDQEDNNELMHLSQLWDHQGIAAERLSREAMKKREPQLTGTVLAGYWLPGVCQVRNPRLLAALAKACIQRGVVLLTDAPVHRVQTSAGRVTGVQTADETYQAHDTVVTAGAWSAELLKTAGLSVPVFPVRGQIVQYRTSGSVVRHILEVGKRYLVPRDDGLVLVGSTEENVGFEKGITEEGVAGLRQFAETLVPALKECAVENTWSGLRPGTAINVPIIGRAPGWSGLWVATGHFRQGLQLSPGTGRLLADAITDAASFADIASFAPDADRSKLESDYPV